LEATAIHETLGQVPVTALKSYFGDLAAGSGAVELIASIMALGHRRVPPTRNLEHLDPACPIEVVRDWQAMDRTAAVALNQSNTGQAAAVVVVSE
jgi:3-oxoacyl-[acyl-carrier-protein] synthase II